MVQEKVSPCGDDLLSQQTLGEGVLSGDNAVALELNEIAKAGHRRRQRARLFMEASDEAKRAYAIVHGMQRYESGETVTHILLSTYPAFLTLDEPWVDSLLAVECGMKDTYNNSSLILLLTSDQLKEFDFACPRFKALLFKQWCDVDNGYSTVLMRMCAVNPQLLNQDWTFELIDRLAGK